ncbi:helicase-like protein [Arthrobacter sp. AG1021]|uniref:DEAD/DEAH box helicase n=1 Tax=Arthrobacter sp. AG1021 TaxID=2183908 RepID=UPI000EB51B55|nr:DEAD/DEAH box helicase [Arthrobacter sp. AG1021]RKS18002.1 helicase-like protein [Arthrobacter sp. AG1021]
MEYQLTPVAAQTLVTEGEYSQGWLMANSGQVTISDRRQMPGRSIVSGWVLRAFVVVQLSIEGTSISFSSRCDAHPEEYSCADVAALLVEATQIGSGGFAVSDVVRAEDTWKAPQAPQWERTLKRLLPQLPTGAEHENDLEEEPLGLILKVIPATRFGRPTLNLNARPARRGTRSPWVQTGVSWRKLPFDGRFAKEQRRAANELVMLNERSQHDQYGHVWDATDWIILNNLPGKDLREAFDLIHETGIHIVNGNASNRSEVSLADLSGSAFLDLRRNDSGLTIEGIFRGPNGETDNVLALGNPPSMIAFADKPLDKAKNLSLAPLEDAVGPELRDLISAGAMMVPTKDIEDFETGYLNSLRQVAPVRSEDASYRVPQPARPVLQLQLAETGTGLTMSFAWKYPPKSPRQKSVEREIISSVNDKLGGDQPLGQTTKNGVFPEQELSKSQAIEFVMYLLPLLEEHPDILITGHEQLPSYSLNSEPAKVSIEAGESTGDWFDLAVEVSINGMKVPFAELLSALTMGDEYLVLEDMTVIPIDGPEFHQLRQLVQEAGELGTVSGNSIRIHRLSIDWWQELVDLGIIEAQENQWLQTMSELTNGEQLEKIDLPDSFTAQLRPYQEQGAAWLNFLRTHSLGGVLADDMGLGKTVQLLAGLEQARTQNPEQKFLVIAPTSVVGNWVNEAHRFTPQMRVQSITSTAKKAGKSIVEQIGDAQLVVTSYAIFRLSFEEFEDAGFSVLILDEAQQLKNHTSKGYKQARQLSVPCKLVVTGTPMENNLMELWALVSLAAPGLLGGQKAFKDNYQKQISDGDSERLERLKKRLRPFVLRRTKEQVVPELPAKTEQVLEVELEPAHRKAYDRRFQRVRQEVLGLVDDVDSNRFKILQSLTLLRQLALDPSLVDEGNAPSAKLEMLRELMADAVAEGHKILVFSQFTSFLGKAKDIAVELGIDHGYLDGATSGPKRKDMIDGFTDGQFPVFFISLKSGGFGINLTTADYCILLDPWWNPAAEAQAIDRAHRIGQTKPVYVYRLVAKDTIESKVLALQAKKTALFNDVLGEQTDAAQSSVLSADDFLALML